MRIAVVTFPGSNCDRDTLRAIDDVHGSGTAVAVWHTERSLDDCDAVILPGGFSWGDYLRCGAMAARAPVMTAVRIAAARGVPILGICNGFQVLCEAGLLPGALLRNSHLKFRCDLVSLAVPEHVRPTPWTLNTRAGQRMTLPIAHGEGRYHADSNVIAELEREGRIVLRYEGDDPNGSLGRIAGICSSDGIAVGMMPHPERAVHEWMGSDDGAALLHSVGQWIADDSRSLIGELR